MIGSILNTARSALIAQQNAVQVTSQNISNAQTEGYSRQRAELIAAPSIPTPGGLVGTGVLVRDVNRMRDSLLDSTYRREAGHAADFGLRKELLGQVEEVFGELSDAGFSRIMDAFWSSWSDLANTPSNPSVRGLVKRNAEQVVFALHDYTHRLGALQDGVTSRVERAVEDVNMLARQLADTNRQVALAESGGRANPGLLDERDRLLDQLSKLAQVQVVERSDYTLGIYLGTATLVDGAQARAVEMDPATFRLRIGTSDIRDVGGTLGAMIEVRDQEVPAVLQRMDDFAETLVTQINALHQPDTGRNFFDPTRTTAGTIQLSSDIADPSTVGSVPGAPGDNRVALNIAALRDQAIAFSSGPNRTFQGFYGDMIADVGLKLNAATRSTDVYDALAAQADIRRTSTSGVNSDEELMQLMRHQQAYAAATKLVSVADEMLQAVLQMV